MKGFSAGSTFLKHIQQLGNYVLALAFPVGYYLLLQAFQRNNWNIVMSRQSDIAMHSFVALLLTTFTLLVFIYPRPVNALRAIIVALGIACFHEILWNIAFFLTRWQELYKVDSRDHYNIFCISAGFLLMLITYRHSFHIPTYAVGLVMWSTFMLLWVSIGFPYTLDAFATTDRGHTTYYSSVYVNLIECLSWVIWVGFNTASYFVATTFNRGMSGKR